MSPPAGPCSKPKEGLSGLAVQRAPGGGEAAALRNSHVRLAARGSRPVIGGGGRRRGAGSCLFSQLVLSFFCTESAEGSAAPGTTSVRPQTQQRPTGCGNPGKAAPLRLRPPLSDPARRVSGPEFPGAGGVGCARTAPSGPGEGGLCRRIGHPGKNASRILSVSFLVMTRLPLL